MSGMGTAREYNDPALVDVRMGRVVGFPHHLIFYRPAESGVEVIRVLHAKRDIESLFGGRGWKVSEAVTRSATSSGSFVSF